MSWEIITKIEKTHHRVPIDEDVLPVWFMFYTSSSQAFELDVQFVFLHEFFTFLEDIS